MRFALCLVCAVIALIVVASKDSLADADRDLELRVNAGLLQGPQVTLHLSATNLGRSTWRLASVDSSCGCLKATPRTNTVPPKESLDIEAVISTDGRLGNQSYLVTATLEGQRRIRWQINGVVAFSGYIDSKRLAVIVPKGEESFVAESWVFHDSSFRVAANVTPVPLPGDSWAVAVGSPTVVSEGISKSQLTVTGRMNGRDELRLYVAVRVGEGKADDRVVVEARRTLGCAVSPAVLVADCSREGSVTLTTACAKGVAVTDVVFGADSGDIFASECKGDIVIIHWRRSDVARTPRVFDVGLVLSNQEMVLMPAIAF